MRQGVPQGATNIILASWRETTKKQYWTYIRKWISFCGNRVDPLAADIAEVLQFLTDLFQEGKGYSAINTARSALSALMNPIDNTPVGSHRYVKRLLKGVFQQRPALPRHNCTWDVSKVLNFLRTIQADTVSLKMLTYKVVMLLALLTGQRIQTLYFVDIRNIDFRDVGVVIRIGDVLKQSRPGYHLSEMSLPAYPTDGALCPVTCLRTYLERLKPLRKENSKLFVSHAPPHGNVTKTTIARWVKETLTLAGVDTNIFTPHSTRAASTSQAKVPLNTILRTAGWAKDCTFRKFYKKPVSGTSDFGLSLLELC